MKRIFHGLCISLSLSGLVLADEAKDIQVETLVKTGLSWDGNRLPGYSQGAPEITIVRIRIAPGAQLPLHKHPVINAGVLLSGELTVMTEQNETLHLHAGDSIVEVVDKWHYGKNEGSTTAEIIVFYAGVTDASVTIKKQ